MALFPNAGIDLVAAVGVQQFITYVGIGTGAGTLASGLTGGATVTSLPLDAGLPAALAAGVALTITDGTNTDTATVAPGGALLGATAIPVASFTPASSYTAHTTGVVPTPQSTDLALYNETARVGATPGTAGAAAGESLNAGYFDSTQATAVYMQVGYFGGNTATASVNTGTLLIADVQFWNHTVNTDSNMFQADSTI
jgi:hypothetical protein